jgi:hypothetical protein
LVIAIIAVALVLFASFFVYEQSKSVELALPTALVLLIIALGVIRTSS